MSIKMLLTAILFVSSFGLAAFAQTVHVRSFDADFDATQLKAKDVVVDAPIDTSKDPLTAMPMEERDQMLSKAGLSEDVKTMDDLDKNLFMTRATRLSVEKLSKRYPKIKKEKLKNLSDALKHYSEKGAS